MNVNKMTPPTLSKQNIKKQHHNHRRKIIIIGDSHARGLAEEMSHQGNKTYDVTGFVKPNAGTATIIDTGQIELNKVTRKDMVILWCGPNDINNHASRKALSQTVNFSRINQETNVVFISIPYRFDAHKRTHLNEEISAYNRKLSKLCKGFESVQLLNVLTDRESFTKYGMHLNAKGKESMVRKLSEVISVSLHKQNEKEATPIF
jgi:hypothetical protein